MKKIEKSFILAKFLKVVFNYFKNNSHNTENNPPQTYFHQDAVITGVGESFSSWGKNNY